MPVPSRPFFELRTAAALSRSLRGAGPLLQPVPAAPAVRQPVAVEEPPARPGFPEFAAPQVQYAEELWRALLRWIQESLGGDAAFALDERGFAIAAVGVDLAAPPEVLLASFTSVAQLMESYLGAERPVTQLVLTAEGEPPVTMFTVGWSGETILIGVASGRPPGGGELAAIRTTITRELARFAEKSVPEDTRESTP